MSTFIPVAQNKVFAELPQRWKRGGTVRRRGVLTRKAYAKTIN
jgi:hypothetical protein